MKGHLHPILAEYVATGALNRALRNAPRSKSELVDCAVMLTDAFIGKVPADEALKRAEVVSSEGEDAGLYIVFLHQWANLAGKLGRQNELAALIKRAWALLPRDALPEVRDLVFGMEGLLAVERGNQSERERLLRKSLDGLGPDSGCRAICALKLAMFLAIAGRLDEIEPELLAMKREHRDQTMRNGCAFMLFLSRAETGSPHEALTFFREFADDPSIWTGYGGTASHWLLLVRFMLRHWEHAELPEEVFARISDPNRNPDWLLVTEALAARRHDDALQLARSIAEKNPRSLTGEPSFPSYSLVRAELACGHGQAATRLIELRREGGNVNWLDDLFLARSALLANDWDGAARHFAAVRKSARRHRAEPRLEIEMHLAGELSGGQILRLVRMADSAPIAPDGGRHVVRAAAEPESSHALGLDRLAGSSAAMARVRETIRQVAPLDVPVLITGETGTGKELVARAIHDCGPRAEKNFLAIDCGAISESLLESELFGHERGAFTGAVRRHLGLFEEAGGGTLLLDEIGNIPPRLQAALLRVLEAGEVRPVGSNRTRKVSCRVLAATNAELDALVAQGRFRADLLFRLKRVELHLSPLRERREDILVLAELFLREGRRDGQVPVLSQGLRAALSARPWPGNVRQLRNTIENMRLFSSDKLDYDVGDLSPEAAGRTGPERAAQLAADSPAETAETARPSASAQNDDGGEIEDGAVADFLDGGGSKLRRMERLRKLFETHGHLTRREAARVLGVSGFTAAKYIKGLCREGLIRKVEPNASPQTHYFRLRG